MVWSATATDAHRIRITGGGVGLCPRILLPGARRPSGADSGIELGVGSDPSIEAAIARAVAALKANGAEEVWLFGSMARGSGTSRSDLDLAVRGVPAGRFFRAVGDAMAASGRPVDLIDLSGSSPLVRRLTERGELRRVG